MSNQTAFEDIQKLCRDFRRQLRSSANKRIEDYLDRVYEDSREMLFQNLLHIDIEFQRRNGHEPSSDDYVKRFPKHAKLVRQAFFESTMMSMSPEVETPANEDTVMFGMLAARKLGDYELLRELGRGGFGVVYQARHVQRGDVVALKTLPANVDSDSHPLNDAERLHKFRREFRALSEINHPHLVGMQTLEVDGKQWFFTMDLVEGVDFLDYVRPGNRLNERRLRAALTQLVAGIIALHDQGIAHRDLKPGNVLVSADGHVSIMDFGLVAELQRRTDQTVSMRSRQFAGTPRYAAPEQNSGVRTTASDWYALGVMLYEALLGEPPFKGTHVDLIVKKQTEAAPQLALRTDVPHDLAVLVDQLLRREPDQRPTGHAIARMLGITIETRSHDSTDSSLTGLSGEPSTVLVGRESQMAELNRVLQEFLQTREPSVVFITGRSGEGKTSLAEKFLERPRLGSDLVVLSGRCYDRESVPFKAVDCLIDALVAFLRSRPTDEVRSLLPDDIHMLAELFPILRRVTAVAEQVHRVVAGTDSRQVRYRAFAALRELLTTIGKSTPVILFVDDLQWGDADSAAALREIFQPPNAPTVMLLGSYRSDEAEESSFLNEWADAQSGTEQPWKQSRIEVAPLTQEQCAALFTARLGIDSDSIVRQTSELFEGSQGNPYFLDQLLESFDAATGQWQAIPLDQIIGRKLQRLPPAATVLLNAVAIAGQAVPPAEVAEVADQSDRGFATLTHMRSERLVRLIGADEQQLVDTWHDKIRETVLSSLGESTRQTLHRRYGEVLEKQEGIVAERLWDALAEGSSSEVPQFSRLFDLAHHFHLANDTRAFIYQLLAGEQALRNYAIEEAIVFYERAQQLLPDDTPNSVQYRLYLAVGRVLLWNNQPERSIAACEKAERAADDATSRARACVGIGHVLNQMGHIDQAIEYYDRAMELLGAPRTTTRVGTLLYVLKTVFQLLFVPARYLRGRSDLERERALIQHDICMRFAISMCEKGLLSAVAIFLRESRESLRTGNAHLIAHGYAHGAFMFSGFGAAWIGILLLRRAGRIESTLNEPAIRGAYLYCEGIARYWGGDLEGAESSISESIPLLQRSGSLYNQAVSAHMLRHVYAYLRSAKAEEHVARDVLKLTRESGNVQCMCWGWYDVASALARRGAISEAMEHMEQSFRTLTNERFAMTEVIRASTFGYVLLQASQFDAARKTALEAWTNVMNCPIDVTMLSLPILIESIAGPKWTTPVPASDVVVLRKLLRRAILVNFSYPNHQPHLHRAAGRALWTSGKHRKAIRRFEKAIKLARRKGMDYQRAKCLLDLAAVKKEGRDEMRLEAIQLLKQMDSVIPHAESWLLGDQFDAQCVAPASNNDPITDA